jgi:hypothetical protein
MVRNFHIRNGTPARPTRSWMNRTPLPSAIRIQAATTRITGESRMRATAAARRFSTSQSSRTGFS